MKLHTAFVTISDIDSLNGGFTVPDIKTAVPGPRSKVLSARVIIATPCMGLFLHNLNNIIVYTSRNCMKI